ncbi:MAG: PKD domain-containing protein [Opitutales bacterium]
MKTTKKIIFALSLFGLATTSAIQARPPLFLMDAARLAEMRQQVTVPGTTHYEAYQALKARVDVNEIPGNGSYERGYMAREASLMYLLTGDDEYLNTAFERLQEIYSVSAANGEATPDSGKGLGRAQTLASFAMAYNWGYDGFTEDQRSWIEEKVNQAFDNYGGALGHPNIEYRTHNSNWNGVVAGAHVMSLIAMDQHEGERRRDYQRSRDIIRTHISSYGDRGWTQEGNYYFGLSTEYTLPAMAAMRDIGDSYAAATFASRRLHHIIMYASSFNAAQNSLTWGVGGDVIPNAGITSALFALIPPGELPAYKWFFDRARGIRNAAAPSDKYEYHAAGTVYTLLFYPEEVVPVSPEGLYPRVMADNRGGYIMRSGWDDENATIVGLWADTTNHDRSWRQADAGQISIISAGTKWTAGPGPATKGLENAFSQIQVDGVSRKGTSPGALLGYSTSPTGGYARVDGGAKFSELNVEQAIRHVLTDFSPGDFDIISTLDLMRGEKAFSYGWNAYVPEKKLLTGTDSGTDYAEIRDGDAYLKIWFLTPGGRFDNENGNVAYRYPKTEDLDIWTVMATGRGTPPSFSTSGAGNAAIINLGSSELSLNSETGGIESSTLTDLNQTTDPDISATPTSGPTPLQVAFEASATADPGETLSYHWDFGDGSTSEETAPTHLYRDPGIYEVLLEVADGNGGADRTLKSIHVGNREPVAVITKSESSVLPGASVTLDASGSSDPDGDPLSYEWDLGDGRTLSGARHAVSWADEDRYKIELRVTDSAGNVHVDRESIRVVNREPKARFDSDSLGGFVPFTVEFDASESEDPEGEPLLYLWNFGDGSPVVSTREPTVSHEFTGNGAFDVKLTVEDPAGKTDKKSHSILALGPEDIVASTSETGEVAQGLSYQVFLGDPSISVNMPEINTLSPIKSGRVAHLDFYVSERDSMFVIRYEGYLKIPETGAYAFRLRTQNAARLFLSDAEVVGSRFPHSGDYQELVALEAGYHPYRFETTYNPEDTYDRPNFNDLTWAPPGTERYRPIPEGLIFSNINLLKPSFIATPGEVYDGGTVMFEATMSSPDGSPLEYLWDFGDGQTATGARVAHTYELPSDSAHQVYSATLRVTDRTGASQTIGEQITVSRYATLAMKPHKGISHDKFAFDKRPEPRNMHRAFNHALEPGTEVNYSSQLRSDLGAAMAADGAYQTRWVSSNPTDYLWFHFQKDGADKRYVISEYSLTAGGLGWTSDRDPRNWEIYGSNDPEPFDIEADAANPSWTLLDTVSGQAGIARSMPTIYALPNTEAYAHYLFRFENQHDGVDGRLELTELQLFSYPDAADTDTAVFGNRPPVADLKASPENGELPLEVSFDAGGTVDPDDDWLYYQWDFGDGHVQHPRLGQSSARHSYHAPGTYTATLTVRDGNGAKDSATQSITVGEATANEPPVPIFTASATSVEAGAPVTFDASASHDPDGDPIRLSWEFGDGRKAEGAVATHSFDKPGRFDVVCIVKDARGRATSTFQRIEVLPPNGGRSILSFNFARRADHMSYTLGAGVLPVANWNNINYGAKPGYFDSHGTPVELKLSSRHDQTQIRLFDELTDRMDGNERLAQIAQTHQTYGGGRGFEWTVEGIPYESYDVYVYYAGADSGKPQAVTVNGVNRFALKNGHDYPGLWTVSDAETPEDAVEGANVLRWRDLSGSKLILQIDAIGSNPAISGFQVVDRSGVPESASRPAP